jgi:predicted nucleic acid-binding Zn ribbon protein
MFCDGCGTALQVGQRFCSRCGKEIAGTMVVGYPQRSRVREHIRLLGILWLALSALNAVGGVVLYILANTLFVHLPEMSGQRAAALGIYTLWVLLPAESDQEYQEQVRSVSAA